MHRLTLALVAVLGQLSPWPALAETRFPATLAGHAVLPPLTFVVPPEGAPRDFWISGKFTGPVRKDPVVVVLGNAGQDGGSGSTGIALPFLGQPLQGFSGFAMDRAADGSIYVLTDNGFGSKANSSDAMLFFSRMIPDFETGAVTVVETVFLRDPDRKVPFRLTNEAAEERWLTGADFDPESIQVVNGEIWIGEEFGPSLLRATMDGRVLGVYPAEVDGSIVRSPDAPGLRIPAEAGKDYTVARSAGFEGMGLQPGTGLLWAMLEKPLRNAEGVPEGSFVRVLAFDPTAGAWTGQSFRLALAEGATAIGDFNFIDATRALVIERDDGEGDPSLACTGDPAPDCFPEPAVLKRVVLIDTADLDAEGFARRIGHIDLMDIADPEGRNRMETAAARDLTGKMTFPFFTIENVMRVDDTHILVANDNNLPFSVGRKPDAAAANEFILLQVPELLAAE
jgi:hypothetical protein